MAKRIYKNTVLAWAKKNKYAVSSSVTGAVLIGLYFIYLSMIGAIVVTGYSGDTICTGTIEDPCYAFINFTANEDIFIYPTNYDPWGRDTPFETDKGLKSWKMYRSWGRGWREISLNKTCTGTWCGASDNTGCKYSIAFRKGRDYQIRIVAYKENPYEDIKWGFGPIDPVWYGIDERDIGYNIFNDTVVIWNTQNAYYFNKSSGIQFTNHYEEYWSRNIFCLGYYSGETWNKIKCADELNNFNRDIQTDNLTYINATLWKDFTYSGYNLRFGVRYHLRLNDKNLSITIYMKNIGVDIPVDLGFVWKVTDLDVPSNETTDKIEINNTIYELNGTYDLTFKDMKKYVNESFPTNQTNNNGTMIYNYSMVEIPLSFYKIYDYSWGLFRNENFLRIDWDENLDYTVKMYGDGQEDYVGLLINAGHFNSEQEKSTTIYWIDASATGGTITYEVVGEINYTIHTFTSSGFFNLTGLSINATILIVAGGGSGGGYTAGGGGAGGLIYNNSFPISAGNYTIIVGAGGPLGDYDSGYGTYKGVKGENSSFDTLIAVGGGRGASYGFDQEGGDGGSGGGGVASGGSPGSGTAEQGYDGGAGGPNSGSYPGGGGGGASEVGEAAPSSSTAGDGGDGLAYSINGTSIYYAGGGGGGLYSGTNSGTGGLGGGGTGGKGTGDVATAGINNTGGGGGGGGGGAGANRNGGLGGSGIVIIRYGPPPDTTPPTYSNNQTNTTGTGELILFSILYDDAVLHPKGTYIFSTNNTGTWTNESAVNFTVTPSWANVTKTLNSTAGISIGYRWYAKDNVENVNNTEIFTLTTTDAINPTASFGTNPVDNYNFTTSSVTFDLKCVDETGVSILKLYGNWTGTWHANQTNSSPINDSFWNVTVSNIPDGNNHIWGVWCNDTSGNSDWTDSNRTFLVDTIKPLISYNPTTDSDGSYKSSVHIFVNISASDTHLDTVVFNWNGTNETFATNEGNNYWENKTSLSDGNYTFYAWANDSSGNSNQTDTRWVMVDTATPLIEYVSPTKPDNGTTSSEKNWIFVNVSVTEASFENITYGLYNSTGSINETTYTNLITNINWTELSDGIYDYNVTVLDKVGFSNSTETRTIYITTFKIFFESIEGDNTVELGTILELLANSTANMTIYVDIDHPAFGDDYSSGAGSVNFNFTVDYFRDTLFSDDAESKTFNYTALDINNLTFNAHQYDEMDAMSINISGLNDPFDVVIFLANSTPDITNQTQFEPLIDRFFDGQLVGDNIYVSQFWNNEEQVNLTFNTAGEQVVYFLLDDIMSTTSTYSFLLNVTGWLFGYSYKGGDSTTRFADYSDIDTTQTTAHLDLSGAIMAKNSSKTYSYYDTYDGSINGTLWGKHVSNPVTGGNRETGSYIQSYVTYNNDDASFSNHVAYVYLNFSYFNLYSSDEIRFRLISDYDADETDDNVDGRSKVYLGNTLIWTSSYLESVTEDSNEKSDADLNFVLTKINTTSWKVEISGVETSTQSDYAGCWSGDYEYAEAIWNWTAGTWLIECRVPAYGGPWSGTLDNSFYKTVNYNSGYTLKTESVATKQTDAFLKNISTKLYPVNKSLYYRENGVIISQSIYDSSADIDEATMWAFGAEGSAGENIYGYLSADNGLNWENVTAGTKYTFDNVGRNLRFKLEINGTGGYFTNPMRVTQVNVSVPQDSPSNISFDFGEDGTADYTISGKINETNGSLEVDLSNVSLSSAFVTSNKWTNIITHNHVYKIPLSISTDSRGVLQVDTINITYNPNPVSLTVANISNVLDSSVNFTTFRIPIRAFNLTTSPVNITVNDIRRDYAGGNQTVQFLVHDADYNLNKTANIIYYYSRWDYTFVPDNVAWIEFIPPTGPVSKNVTPFGQTSTIPILNLTNYGYGGLDANISVTLSSTFHCVNLTLNTVNNETSGYLLDTDWSEFSANVPYLNITNIFLWADYDCTSQSNWTLFNPNLIFRQSCQGCLSSEEKE